MDSDSVINSLLDSSDEDDGPNNPQPQPPVRQDSDDGGSTASIGPAPPPQGHTPPEPPTDLQLKKQECCDVFNASLEAGAVYESPDALQAAVVDLAKPFHFSIRKEGYSFLCSRAIRKNYRKTPSNASNATNSSQKIKRKANSFKTECPFRISYNYCDLKLKHELTPEDLAQKGKKRNSDMIRITKICAMHGPNCQLHTRELQSVLKKGGHLSRFESGAIAQVINMVNNAGGKFNAKDLRAALLPHFPPGYQMTSQDVVNFRIWCKKNAERVRKEGHSVTFDPISIGSTIKQWSTEASPISMEEAGETLREVLQQSLQDSHWEVEKYLQTLKNKCPGFDYRIWTKDNHPQGVVWQTPFQRAAFELFGDVLFLDAMKRSLNHLHWPYFGPTVLDSDGHIMTCCEAICSGEKVDSYKFVVGAMFEMSSHARARESVRVIFSDKILDRSNSEELLQSLSITDSCKVFWDYYHITSKDWPDHFKNSWCGGLQEGMMKMISSSTVQGFQEGLLVARSSVATKPNFLSYIDSWVEDKQFWAKHERDQWCNTLGYMGSSLAESNHASVCAFVGDLYAEPHEEIKVLIQHNQRMMKLQEQRLAKAAMHLQSEKATHTSPELPPMLQAKLFLGDKGFSLWEGEWNKRNLYRKRLLPGGVEVFNTMNPTKNHFIPDDGQCCCLDKRHLLVQCRHELCADEGRFVPERNSVRWKRLARAPTCNRANSEQISFPPPRADPPEPPDDGSVPIPNDSDDIELQEGPQGFSQMMGAQSPPSPSRVITHRRLTDLATHLVDLAMHSGRDGRQSVAGFLSLGIEALRGNGNIQGLSLQEAANKFVISQINVASPHQGHEVFTQESETLEGGSVLSQSPPSTPGTGVLPPTERLQHPHGRAKKRLKSSIEINRDKHKRPRKDQRQCTFCGLPNHTSQTCSQKRSIGFQITGRDDKNWLYNEIKNCDYTHNLSHLGPEDYKFNLPKEVQSILFIGKGKVSPTDDTSLDIAVCKVYSKGANLHATLSQTGLHYISVGPILEYIWRSSTRRYCFVVDGGNFQPKNV